jgi:hypothetical protein
MAGIFPHRYLPAPKGLCQFLGASPRAHAGSRPSRSHCGRQLVLPREIYKHPYVPASGSSDKPSRNTGFPSLRNERQTKGEALTATNLQPPQACLPLFTQMLPPGIQFAHASGTTGIVSMITGILYMLAVRWTKLCRGNGGSRDFWLYRLFGPWQTFCHIGLAGRMRQIIADLAMLHFPLQRLGMEQGPPTQERY